MPQLWKTCLCSLSLSLARSPPTAALPLPCSLSNGSNKIVPAGFSHRFGVQVAP